MERSPMEMTRRDACKTLALGVLVSGVATVGKAENLLRPTPRKPPPQPFVLPPLPYGYSAMEPYLDARTMELHHSQHHQAYIDEANRALAEHPEYQRHTAEQLLQAVPGLPENLRNVIRNMVGGHVNHSFFWSLLSPHAARYPGGRLLPLIEVGFGSFEAFQTRLIDTGMKVFGSGWVWLSLRKDGKLLLHATANQDSPVSAGLHPLLGIDIWEHAYYLKYENRRHDYLTAVQRCLDWHKVEANLAEAREKLSTPAT